MPSGPKKRRRAAAKKKEQAEKSSSLPSVELPVVISNQETEVVISNQETEVVERYVNNPVLSSNNGSEDVVVGQCVSLLIEAVEKAGSDMLSSDKSVHVESNRAVGSETLASDIVEEIDHESNQSVEKALSVTEMLDSSELLMNNQQLKNTTSEVDHESNQTVAKAGSEKMASDLLTTNELVKNIVGEIDHNSSNQSDEKAGSEFLFSEKSYSMTSVELHDEDDEHFTVNPVLRNNNVIEDVAGKEFAEKTGSKGLSSDSVTSIGEDKSVHDSNRAEGSESLGLDMLTSNEPVKNIADEIGHGSNQSVEKAVSEPLVALDSSTTSNEPPKNAVDETNKAVESESLASDISIEPEKKTADVIDIESYQDLEKALSEMLASNFSMNNEEVKIDHESNQTVAKAPSEMLTSSNDLMLNTTDEVIEAIQAADKAESEMIVSDLLTTVQDHCATVSFEEVSVGEDNADNEVIAKRTNDIIMEEISVASEDSDESNVISHNEETQVSHFDSPPATEIIHSMMAKEEAIQLLIEKSSSTISKDVQNSCDTTDTDYDALKKVISESTSSSQMKRVKEILEKELMATEKLRLVLKKAIDELIDAIHTDEAAA